MPARIKIRVLGHGIVSTSNVCKFEVETDYTNGKVYLSDMPDNIDTHVLREYAVAIQKAADLMDKYCPDEEE